MNKQMNEHSRETWASTKVLLHFPPAQVERNTMPITYETPEEEVEQRKALPRIKETLPEPKASPLAHIGLLPRTRKIVRWS